MAITYVLCGLVVATLLPRALPRDRRDWVASVQYAVAWLAGMAGLYTCFGLVGAVFGNMVAAKLVGGSWLAVASLGIVGWLGIPLADTALMPGSVGLSLGLAVAIGLAVTPVLMCAGWLPEMRQFYPEMRLGEGPATAAAAWRWRLAMIGSWLVYLVGYEALFRGLLLPLLARELGLWPGIAVATGLYVLAHLARPAAESLAAIPAGFIMAAITLVTGSILAAIVLHWIIASVNETVSAVREKKGTRIF